MFQERIREHYEELTPGFRKLADFLMDSTLDAAFLTATELSRRVGVDPATVVRFAQELGYSGYRELSREIKRYVRDQVTSSYREAEETSETETFVHALIDGAQQTLEHFVTTDIQQAVQAIDLLKGASRIWLTGEYTGYDVASFVAKKFQVNGVPARVFRPSMAETADALSEMQEGEALITIAESTPSLDTGYAVRMARAKGLKTVTITCSGVILPAREAEATIIIPCKSSLEVESFGVLMIMMDIIWQAMLDERDEALEEHANQIQQNMEKLLQSRTETAEYEVASPEDLWRGNFPS